MGELFIEVLASYFFSGAISVPSICPQQTFPYPPPQKKKSNKPIKQTAPQIDGQNGQTDASHSIFAAGVCMYKYGSVPKQRSYLQGTYFGTRV